MTSPADRPPLPPERGNPVRAAITIGLCIAGAVFTLIASALAGPHVHHGSVPVAVCGGLAGACLGAAVVVLAGKGRQQ